MPANPHPLDAAARAKLARLATETRDAWNAYAAAPDTAAGNDARVDYLALRADFKSACSPDVILALLAAVERGEAETARLDFLEAFCDDLTFYHSRGGEPEPVLSWFAGDGDSVTQTQGPTWRAAIDAAMADASPDAARAHPPIQETDDA